MSYPHHETTCSSCGAKIMFVTNQRTGNRVPVNAQPVPVFGLEEKEGKLIAFQGKPSYVSHFTTCPNAGAHSKKGAK